METDQGAPLSACKEALVGVPPEVVWGVQADIEGWRRWQPGVSSVQLGDPLAVGTSFKWKANGASITSTIQELEPGRTIGWTGKSLGMQAVHVWRFEPRDGGTQVTTEESLSGWLATLIKLFDRQYLEKSLANSLQALKDEAERRSTS